MCVCVCVCVWEGGGRIRVHGFFMHFYFYCKKWVSGSGGEVVVKLGKRVMGPEVRFHG